jgi:hypothetical protein
MFGLLWPDGSLSDVQHNPINRPGAKTVEVLSVPKTRGPMRYDAATKAATAAPPGAARTLQDAMLLMLVRGNQAPQWARDLAEAEAKTIPQ